VPVHNNNRDGMGQMFIPLNTAAYTPNTLNDGAPQQANQTVNNGFFTTPGRTVTGRLIRAVSSTFADVWSQPRLFYNSLVPVEQQFLINAIRFEVSHVQSSVVKQNVITQLNRVDNDLAKRVAAVVGVPAPAPDSKFYHNNKTDFVTIYGKPLFKIDGLKVGVLVSVTPALGGGNTSLAQATQLKAAFQKDGADVIIVGETLVPGVDQTYSSADAIGFDGIIVADGADALFKAGASSAVFPTGRPGQILTDGYRWGKPIGALGSGKSALQATGVNQGPGVFVADSGSLNGFITSFEGGLKTFKFLDRFPVDK
jgi:catalase